MFDAAGSEEAVKELTRTEAKVKFGIVKPKPKKKDDGEAPRGASIPGHVKVYDGEDDAQVKEAGLLLGMEADVAPAVVSRGFVGAVERDAAEG